MELFRVDDRRIISGILFVLRPAVPASGTCPPAATAPPHSIKHPGAALDIACCSL